MTTIKAQLNHLRVAPRKTRLVADMIRGKSAVEAEAILKQVIKRSADPMAKLLKSAIANAKHNFKIEKKDLKISKVTVDEGPMLKRGMPRSRGQVFPIQKKTSHIILELEQIKTEK